MHLLHCWHEVEGSVRKIPFVSKCKLEKQLQFIHTGNYINCTIKYRCCICGKIKEIKFKDYFIQRANLYKSKINN